MKILFTLVLGFISVVNVSAMDVPQSAQNCHCFKDRTFEKERKTAADPYLLTTSFNSFISANFNTSKRRIVMMLMQGAVQPEDLLVGLYVARAAKTDVRDLLALVNSGMTWKQIIESKGIKPSSENEKVFDSIIDPGKDKKKAVEAVTDDLVKEFFGVSGGEIKGLREEGANGREVTLVYILEKRGKVGKKAFDILQMHTRKGMSWGEIADSFGLTPKQTGKLLVQNR